MHRYLKRARALLLENWHLKFFSLVLATGLWVVIDKQSTSEIFFDVPVEFQNVPPNSEVIGETSKTVQVRLRGPSTLIREMTAKQVTPVVDLGKMAQGGEKSVPLNPQLVDAPFGVEVVRITPTSLKLSLEPSLSLRRPIAAPTSGHLPAGYEVDSISVNPGDVRVQGPAPHIRAMSKVVTMPVDLTNKRTTFIQTMDLDASDTLIRFPETTRVRVEVKIRKKS
jgi:YbbR domain-containing protein